MSEVVKLGDLALPIPGDLPAGVDLREDLTPSSPYRALKDLRNQNRSIERRMDDGEAKLPSTNWDAVLRGSTEILANRSKDLEVASWAIEALVRLYGFAGLAQGFDLVDQIVSQYWDGLFPSIEGSDISYRIAPLVNLNGVDGAEGTLISPINRVPLIVDKDTELARWHYAQVLLLAQREPAARQRLIDNGAITSERFQKAGANAKPEAVQATYRQISEALAAFKRLQATLVQKCGSDAPPSSTIQGALEECLKIVGDFSAGKVAETSAATPGSVVASATAATPTRSETGDREQIFATVEQCAAALRSLEPQSIIPAILERAVKWGRLPVDQLLRQIVAEDSALNNISRLTGVNYYTPPEKDD